MSFGREAAVVAAQYRHFPYNRNDKDDGLGDARFR